MAVQTPVKTGFEKWQDGLGTATSDARWNAWDCEVQWAVNEYNLHLTGTPGYARLDWLLIKTMLWVETGANSSEWNSKPMQIGVTGDPGLAALLSKKEGGPLILPKALQGRLTTANARTMPAFNIRAGIGYLLMRMANFDHQTVEDLDPTLRVVEVKRGDSLDAIAKANGSTVDVLKQLNAGVNVLHPGQKLKVRKATVQQVITGWRTITTTVIAQRYNGGGDPNYARKLDYALGLVRQTGTTACTR